jgi:hypothetical protein
MRTEHVPPRRNTLRHRQTTAVAYNQYAATLTRMNGAATADYVLDLPATLPMEWGPPLSRLPGMPRGIIDPVDRNLSNVLRGNWWGTDVRHHFYWYEPHPLGAMMNRNY